MVSALLLHSWQRLRSSNMMIILCAIISSLLPLSTLLSSADCEAIMKTRFPFRYSRSSSSSRAIYSFIPNSKRKVDECWVWVGGWQNSILMNLSRLEQLDDEHTKGRRMARRNFHMTLNGNSSLLATIGCYYIIERRTWACFPLLCHVFITYPRWHKIKA